jgi:hypothetical protein
MPGEEIEEKSQVFRVPARNRDERKSRWDELVHQTAMRLARRHPRLGEAERFAMAEAEVASLLPEEPDEEFEAQWTKLQPVYTPDRASTGRTELIGAAAIMLLPQIRWLFEYLCWSQYGPLTNRKAEKVERGRVVTALLYMAFCSGKPSIRAARERVACERNVTLSWAFDWPARASQNDYRGFNKSLHGVCGRKDPAVVRHMTVEFMRTLSQVPTRKGKNAAHYVPGFDIGFAAAIDATFTEAHLVQKAFVPDRPGASPNHSRHARERRGQKHKRVRAVAIVRPDGSLSYRIVGYKWLSLTCIRANRSMIGRQILAANTSIERWGVLSLLSELFTWWPECPLTYLVGDALYAQEHEFIATLYRYWGILLIAPVPAGQVAPKDQRRGRPGAITDKGTPVCTCRRKHGPRHMIPYSWDDLYTPARRAREGILRGQPAPVAAYRIRWRCPNSVGGNKGCGPATTRSSFHWAFCSYLPHTGGSSYRKLRAALLLSRNRIESWFSCLKRFGVGNKGTERAQWANDEEMELLLALGTLRLLLDKVIHTKGAVVDGLTLYELAEATAAELGLDTSAGPATEEEPALSADRKQLLRRRRDDLLGPPRPPASLGEDGTARQPVLAGPQAYVGPDDQVVLEFAACTGEIVDADNPLRAA